MEEFSLLTMITTPPSLLNTPRLKSPMVFSHSRFFKKRALTRLGKQEGHYGGDVPYIECASLIRQLSRRRVPHLAHKFLLEMKSEGFLPDSSTLSSLLMWYADNGLLPQAKAIWEEILNSCFVPNTRIISKLFDAHQKMGQYGEVIKILNQVKSRKLDILPEAYSLAISCFGKGGQLELMEDTLREMVSSDIPIDSSTGNSFLVYYSIFGSLLEMENVYGRLKRSRLLIEKEGIKAMSSAYLKQRKFYRLGEFLTDVGLRRRNVGNLLWNLLLLSYAANFKMKSLQREFLNMVDAGFSPDITTFNIRALAFSKMALFWDLHLSLEHMKHEKVVPDLVTYGCVIDAYMDRRLGRNLEFAFSRMNLDDYPVVLTESYVFEALGKGDFHSSAEAFLEFKQEWTYREIIATYVKKKYRRNQIFWNY